MGNVSGRARWGLTRARGAPPRGQAALHARQRDPGTAFRIWHIRSHAGAGLGGTGFTTADPGGLGPRRDGPWTGPGWGCAAVSTGLAPVGVAAPVPGGAGGGKAGTVTAWSSATGGSR